MNQSKKNIEEIAWEFIEFIDCLGKTNCGYYNSIYFYLQVYYGSKENLIKELNANELALLKNKQGERIVSDEIIQYLMQAKQYAFSSDPKKKQQYRCKIAIRLGSLAEEVFKIEAVTTVNCISNSYLKASEEDYEDYLMDTAMDKIFEEYPLSEIRENEISSYSLVEYQPM